MNLDFKGYNENVATFKADDTVEVGVLVKMNGNYTVTACAQNDDFMGICVGVRDGYAAIQTSGYFEIGSTSTLAPGYKYLNTYNSKTVKPSTDCNKYLIVYNGNGILGIIL